MLKLIFPQAKLHVWVKSRAQDLVNTNTNIDKVIVFDHIRTSSYGETNSLSFREKIKFISRIRSEKYDLYIDLTGKYMTALVALFGKIKFTIGLNYNGFGFCYNKYFKINTQETEGHLIDKYLEVIKFGLDLGNGQWVELLRKCTSMPEISIPEHWIETAKKELLKRDISTNAPIICIHTTAGWKQKQWEANKFALLFDILVNRLKYQIIIVGDESDTLFIDEISRNLERHDFLDLKRNFIPLPLMGTAGLIYLSHVFVGADSVPLHIASAINKPAVALFGPTNPEFSKPRNSNSVIIYKSLPCSAQFDRQYCSRNAGRSCGFIECMNQISVEEVTEKITFLLNNYK